MKIIGRHSEKEKLQKCLDSEKAEFIAVFGRRRVGKTFLIKEFFKNDFTFYISGLANATKKEQIENFNYALNIYGKSRYYQSKSWLESFRQLANLLESSRKKGKKIVFIDEISWFDTARSDFLKGIELFWNGWASCRSDVILILCGSTNSWIIKKLLNNWGGLYNRVTQRIPIQPFNLSECEEYFEYKKIKFEKKNILDSYMIFGGIPYYLNLFEKGLSLAQNVDKLCFMKNSELQNEFSTLYSSLFKNSKHHESVIKALARKRMGLTREEIKKETKLQGGGLTTILEELEQCDFISSFKCYKKKSKERLYQLIDFFSLFYLNFIKNKHQDEERFWVNIIDNAKHRDWSNYAFQQVCILHYEQIKRKLGISGVATKLASWRSKNPDHNTKIDFLFERKDGIIHLCEMRYSGTEYLIDKKMEKILRDKKYTFMEEMNIRKSVQTTMVTIYGVERNEYWSAVQSEIKIKDLFVNINNE